MPSTAFKSIADADFHRLAAHIPLDELRGQTVLLTGATGFFGAWLLALFGWMNACHGAGARAVAVSRDPAAFVTRHPQFLGADWLDWIAGDIRDFPQPQGRIDAVLHAATDTSAEAGRNPALLLETIVAGTRHVLDVAERGGAGRVLLTSSGAVYGGQPAEVMHVAETARTAPSPLDPAQAYGEGKRVMELLGAIHAQQTGAAVVIARCFAFVGAGLPLDGHFAIGNFIRDALWSERIVIKGGGTAERSYLYAADLAIWLLRLLVSGTSAQAYNVGSDQALSIAALAHTVVDTLATGKTVLIEGKDDPSKGRNRYIPSIAKARGECGLDVWTDLPQAIRLTAAHASQA